MKYLVFIEKTQTGYSAYSPDVLGCVSTGATLEEVNQNMQEAIEFHIDGLIEEGLEIPKPSTLMHCQLLSVGFSLTESLDINRIKNTFLK